MKRITALTIILICFLVSNHLFSQHQYPEIDYNESWCDNHNGTTGQYIPDSDGTGGTYCDCLFEQDGYSYAVEFDFANKWYEAVGQALYYAEMTARIPMVVLILEDAGDVEYLERLQIVADKLEIRVETMDVSCLY